MVEKRHLLLLFERPQEPCFMIKGSSNTVFELPPEYLNDEYVQVKPEVVKKYRDLASEIVHVKPIRAPALGEILNIRRDENFTHFIPKHRRIGGKLVTIFLDAKTLEDLLSVAIYARERVNPYLFGVAFAVALLHRPDTQDVDIPSIVHYFPDKFIDGRVFAQARAIAALTTKASRVPIEVPLNYTATDVDEEHRVAYFREDIGINLHHHHWHLAYPFDGPDIVVKKDRRGELFLYSHQQIIARYNFERLANNLKRLKSFEDWDGPIREAYFPKLDSLVTGHSVPSRAANLKLQDISREWDQVYVKVEDLTKWRDRIRAAIHAGVVKGADGNDVALTEERGTNIIGDVIESSKLSPNRPYYGDMHNMGHLMGSLVHDPDGRYLEPIGPVGDDTTAVRDPFLHTWHSYVEDILQEYKATLPGYDVEKLNHTGVSISQVEVHTEDIAKNVFRTFWQKTDVDITKGLDFHSREQILVRVKHIQHSPFIYNIVVNNDTADIKIGTYRIFLAPKFDDEGKVWSFREQRKFFIEMDKFRVQLKPGRNIIKRTGKESSVTIPHERIYRDVDTNSPPEKYCICGWPENMLVPRGTTDGMQCQLFVMISNYEDDKIEQSTEGKCVEAYSYCGVKDKLYPDRRVMGYPFDRLPRSGVETLQQFLTPNMNVTDVTIKFENRVIETNVCT